MVDFLQFEEPKPKPRPKKIWVKDRHMPYNPNYNYAAFRDAVDEYLRIQALREIERNQLYGR